MKENAIFIAALAAVYIALISILSMIVTISDKLSAVRGKRRVPEKTLLLLSALGGSLAMYLTMRVIRHKTRHIKFMLGIPIIMLFQGIVLWYCAVQLGFL